ncbi:MAG: ATP-binding protein [Myxococcota bacterium]
MPTSRSLTAALPGALGIPEEELPRDLLFNKLKWLTLLRLILATCLFGSTLFLQIRNQESSLQVSLLYALSGLMYLSSGIYAALLKHVRALERFAYQQFLLDTVFVTLVIYVTGGLESIFSFLYFWVIISASYLLYTPGGFILAGVSGVGYALMVTFQVRRTFPSFAESLTVGNDLSYVFYNVTINVFAFFLVAFLSSYLAEQLKRTKEALLEEQINLRELEELNQKIVENISSGVISYTIRGQIVFINRAAETILGLTRETWIGAPIETLFPHTLEVSEPSPNDDGTATSPPRWERPFMRDDETRLYLGFARSPLLNPDGARAGTVLLIEDLTRIKLLEQKARRDDRLKVVNRLSAGLAHELRNPLASISGSIQVLRDELDLRDENRTLMDIVVRETDRLNALLTDFLQYVKPSQQERHPLDLERVLREVVEALRYNPRCARTVRFEISCHHQQTLLADPGQLRQVLWNLALNAVEVMPDGGLVELRTRDLPATPEEPARIELTVADTGPGVDEQQLERLFDPFFTTKPGGTGLGLSVVEKIIQGHDGAVRVRRRPEGGTLFEVLLPVASPVLPELTPQQPLKEVP